jgi:hypothetical protein
MINTYFRLIAALFVLSAFGCSSIYMPSVPNTPMLTTQGELAAGAHMSLKGNFNFNSAYAVSNHFAVLANGAYLKNDSRKKDVKHKMIEVGGGFFNTFGPDKNRIIEVYAGLGTGRNERLSKTLDDNKNVIGTDFQEAKYEKKFIQVNYSSKKKSNLKLFGANFGLNYGTALRVSFAKTNDFYRNGILQANEDNIFLEPIFFTRMILSDQVQLQYTSGSNFGLKSRKFLNAGNSVFSIGAVVNLGRAPKK